jgi:hypothetical protein
MQKDCTTELECYSVYVVLIQAAIFNVGSIVDVCARAADDRATRTARAQA